MGRFFLLFGASLVIFSGLSRAESPAGPTGWVAAVKKESLPSLQAIFTQKKSQHLVTAGEAADFQSLLASMRQEAATELLAAHLLLLTGFLETVTLEVECLGYCEPGRVARLRAAYRAQLSRTARHSELAEISAFFQTQGPRFAELQLEWRTARERENVAEFILRVRGIALLGKKAEAQGALPHLEKALQELAAKDEAAALKSVDRGLRALLPQRWFERFDRRHLLHLFQLQIVVAYVQQAPQVSAEAKASLQTLFESLTYSLGEIEYASVSQKLSRLIDHLVESGLDRSDLLVFVSPFKARRLIFNEFQTVALAVPQVKEAFGKNQTFLQGLHSGYNRRTEAVLQGLQDEAHDSMRELQRCESIPVLRGALRASHWVRPLANLAFDATLERSAARDSYAELLTDTLRSMALGYTTISADQYRQLRANLAQEAREGFRRAWFNRQNATVAALSTLLLAEAIAIPFSGGGSATAMPATLQAIATLTVAGAKTVVISNSVLNIADRTKDQGAWGLVTIDTAFDALVILSMSPRPVPTGPGVAKFVAQQQYSAGVILTGVGTGYGGYLLYNAEKISRELSHDGVVVSPEEIRRKGLLNMAMGILATRENIGYYARGKAAGGEKFESAIRDATWAKSREKLADTYVRPIRSVRTYYAKNPGPVRALQAAGLSAAYVGTYALLLNEGLLFSYSNLDSNYMDHVVKAHPLPTLKEKETAVILVGFEPEDSFLYRGAHATYSHHRETLQFGKDRVFVYDYDSPEDVLRILQEHARKNGKIRYLKFATHGRPGVIFSRKVNAIPESGSTAADEGWINVQWLQARRSTILRVTRSAMAPDARLVLWACLSGSNLDPGMQDEDDFQDAGDRFMQALGDTFLPGGGAIDASRRVLIGLEATLGGHDHQTSLAEFSRLQAPPPLVLPLIETPDWKGGTSLVPPLEVSSELLAGAVVPRRGDTASPVNEDSPLEASEFSASAQRLGSRIWSFVKAWPPYWYKYGVALEGPFWQNRYRYLEVAPHF